MSGKKFNLEEAIEAKKKLISEAQELDNYLEKLLSKKRENLDKIDELTAEHIKPLKEDNSQIDAEIERIMFETDMDKFRVSNYGAYNKFQTCLKVTDPEKALKFALKHPQILKKDIIKSAEVDKLVAEGIVPDVEVDGININDTIKKIEFKKL